MEKRIAGMIADALPPARRTRLAKARVAHVLIMAFDRFAIDRHLHPRRIALDDITIDAVTDMLLGE